MWGGGIGKVQLTLPTQRSAAFLRNQLLTPSSHFSLFSPPHTTLPSPLLMFTCSLEAELPRQEAATHRRGIIASTGHLSRLPHPAPHKRHNRSPDLPHSPPCVAPFTRQTRWMQNGRAVRKQSSRLGLGRHDSSFNTTCSTLLQPTLQNTPPAMAALNGHTRRHLFTLDRINDDLQKIPNNSLLELFEKVGKSY